MRSFLSLSNGVKWTRQLAFKAPQQDVFHPVVRAFFQNELGAFFGGADVIA
jgi:hypothetical protein